MAASTLWYQTRFTMLTSPQVLKQVLKHSKPKDHADLFQRATELKRLLTALQKLNADR